jgi:hypothetical protein
MLKKIHCNFADTKTYIKIFSFSGSLVKTVAEKDDFAEEKKRKMLG